MEMPVKTALIVLAALCLALPATARERWTPEQANAWYEHQPWPLGANYLPADAINQLEMWQEASFNPAGIEREMGWAQGTGADHLAGVPA